tara:strand:- start:107 stop:637 length:531 start_codon:yes stop_codon:yes gene_type:complete
LHSEELVTLAELLEAEGVKLISECKEEISKKTDDGRRFTVLSSSKTYNGTAGVNVYIDAARGREELMKGQVACVVLVFVFPDNDLITYRRGGNHTSRLYSVAPPRGGRLYCVIDTHLSEASRKALIGIDFPKALLYWGLCKANGMELDDNWLEANPPDGTWSGEPPSRGVLLTFDP